MKFLSITILSYFTKVHGKTLTTSSALELLMDIREFKQIHESHIKEFKSFNGLSYEVILEVLNQEIHHLEQSQKKFEADGHLLTEYTKQYNIDSTNKETEIHLSANNTEQWLGALSGNIAKEVDNVLFTRNNQKQTKRKKTKKEEEEERKYRTLDMFRTRSK